MTTTQCTTLHTVLADGVLEITLDRPDRLNAWTYAMGQELTDALRSADADPAVRVVLLTGAGRAFCVGADMESLTTLGAGRPPDPLPAPAALPLLIGTPVVAVVNGPCAGIGLAIALACDVRFASTEAVFTTAFAKVGLVAEHGIGWLLPRVVGSGRARDMLLSSRRVSAEEGHRFGLVDFLCAPNDLLDKARVYAVAMAAACSPRALADMKQALLLDADRSFDAALADADRRVVASMSWPDVVEGVSAFTERRTPHFPGTSSREWTDA